ncbi:FadR/GntR family transcriptional regulator [Clostridium sp. MB40-C1]|uniref:FadR/GntR family transcriptional regulator n=1 Tax=Clostridium sp. MB40-C1 TaxID=3070996 RepID=UPI0027E1EC10|nr:FadR/GntR family transcriptional regulator [Clostridium sp. MB40-C1]WMJ80595.1 FadR/GntR family transcriptional regulator [Clostridium sp. MB40-C1]
MGFRSIENKKVSQLVIQQIKDSIYDKKLKKGDRLPTVSELQKTLGVSRTSIREAFSALELIGVIETRTGEGTFIANDGEGIKFLEPLSLILALEENVVEELLELRLVLECDCIRLAVNRITDEELDNMKNYIEILENSNGNEKSSIEADMMFHYTIAKASRNKVLYQVLASISEVMNFHIKNTRTRLVSDSVTMNTFIEQHLQIYNAMKKRDEEAALDALKGHLDYLDKLINMNKNV